MRREIVKLSEDISALLNNSDYPISTVEIQQYLDVPYYLLNLSLARLIGEEKIQIDTRNERNYISSAFYEHIDRNEALQNLKFPVTENV